MEVPNPVRFLRFRPWLPRRTSQRYTGQGPSRIIPPFLYLVAFLLFLQFGVHALFLGQMTSFPLFWGLFLVLYCSLLFSFLQVSLNRNFHAWLWGALIIVFVLKFLFYPAYSFSDSLWLKELGSGFKDLSQLGWGLLYAQQVIPVVAEEANAAAALFFSLSLIFWLPAGISMDRALRYHSWGWPIVLSLAILVWLEPTRTFSFFFLFELILGVALFLLLLTRKREERWHQLRFRHSKDDLRRILRWSLLIFLPLLIFLIPWAWGSITSLSVFLPAFPSLETPSPSPPPAFPESPSPVSAFPYISLPPFALPGWVEVLGGLSSYVAVILLFLICVFLYFRFGKSESLAFFLGFLVLLVLALWLLPPYLGPIMTRFFFYLKQAADYVLAALGLKRPSGGGPGPEVPSGQGSPGEVGFLTFIRSVFSFFSQTSAILITVAVVFLAVALFFVLRFGLRKWKGRASGGLNSVKRAGLQEKIFLSPLSFYFKLLDFLEARGIKRHQSETPYEFARRTVFQAPFVEAQVSDLTQAFIEARYAQFPVSPQKSIELERELAEVQRKFKEQEVEENHKGNDS